MIGRRRALALLVGVAVASSASGSFAKSLIEAGWSTGSVALLRPVMAMAVLFPMALVAVRRRRPVFRGSGRAIVLLGVLGIAGTNVCYYNAVARMPVGTAMMLLYLSPVLVLVWLWLRQRQRPDLLTVLGAIVALGGLVLVVAAMGVDRPDPAGVAWGLLGAVCSGSYYITTTSVSTTVSPLVLACAGQLFATLTVAGLALVGIVSLGVGEAQVRLGGAVMSAIVPILLLGSVSTAFISVFALAVVRVLGARLSSFMSLVEPVAALGVAWVLVGERPHPVQYAGCALIVAGVAAIRGDPSPRLRRVRAATTEPFPPPS